MDTNTETEGQYVASLSERDRDIYSRGYNTGILARSRIDFGPVPTSTAVPTATLTPPTAVPEPTPEPSPTVRPRTYRGTPTPQPTSCTPQPAVSNPALKSPGLYGSPGASLTERLSGRGTR